MKKTMAMILAGGEGTRLSPLTTDRAKPAVPFGGRYRIIDFVLSNFINSGIVKLKILTQFKSDSLNKHLSAAWNYERAFGGYIDLVPAQMRTGKVWYQGTADAIYQNINLLNDSLCERIAVFGGDHVYKMDIQQIITYHDNKNTPLTIAAIPVKKEESIQFGIIQVDENNKIIGFQEKPEIGKTIPGNCEYCLASMGNYIFDKDILIKELKKDADENGSVHDFGKNIIPSMLKNYDCYVYNFSTNEIPGQSENEKGYWKDVGTIDAYYEANMDLISVHPSLDLYNQIWKIHTYHGKFPPAKFVHEKEGRTGMAIRSLISEGVIISGAVIKNSILSPAVRVNSFSTVDNSIIFEGVHIGRNCKVKNAIIDKDVVVPNGTEIGYNLKEDRKKYTVTDNGIVVIGKKEIIK